MRLAEPLAERGRGTFAITHGPDFGPVELAELSIKTGRPVTWTALNASPGAFRLLDKAEARFRVVVANDDAESLVGLLKDDHTLLGLLWAACQETDTVVNMHIGSASPVDPAAEVIQYWRVLLDKAHHRSLGQKSLDP